LASVTSLYAWYFNVVQKGKLYKKIEELHGIYGKEKRLRAHHRRDRPL